MDVSIVLILVVVGAAFVWGKTLKEEKSALVNQPETQPTRVVLIQDKEAVQPSSEPTLIVTSTPKKSFSSSLYEIQYPDSWNIITNEYLGEGFTLNNPEDTVSLTISPFQYPFGFGGPSKMEQKNIQLVIGGKSYPAVENIQNGENAWVNLEVIKDKLYVLFGTGYPGGFGEKHLYQIMKNTNLKFWKFLKI